jgi:hypothetical protein
MKKSPDQHTNLGWWLQLLPLIVLGAIAFVLWKPAPDPPPSREQEAKIADLAARLGSTASTAVDIDDRLRSFGPFPPDPKASRALAEALISCETTKLDESRRTQLARYLYGITVVGDDRAAAIPAALIGIQQTVAGGGPTCGPSEIDSIVSAARAVATTDPNPRKNWW